MQESRHAYASARHYGKDNAIEKIEMRSSAFCIPPTRFKQMGNWCRDGQQQDTMFR